MQIIVLFIFGIKNSEKQLFLRFIKLCLLLNHMKRERDIFNLQFMKRLKHLADRERFRTLWSLLQHEFP